MTIIKPHMRVWHHIFGLGTVVVKAQDPYSKVDYDELKICFVQFDKLKEGYSNPFMLDWESVVPVD